MIKRKGFLIQIDRKCNYFSEQVSELHIMKPLKLAILRALKLQANLFAYHHSSQSSLLYWLKL